MEHSIVWARARFFWLAAGLALMTSTIASGAHAALGQSTDSVLQDRAHLSARLASTSGGAYTVHTLTSANGAVVREYAGADGVVFAITWRGPGRPDLRQLLGDRFAIFQADNKRVGARTKAPLTVNRADFVARSSGHPGAFWGAAYLPPLLPSGFSPIERP